MFYADPNPSEAMRILQKYQVSYVIVGQMERLYYPPAGLAKFESGLNGSLEMVYENPGTTIYRVLEMKAPVAVADLGPSSGPPRLSAGTPERYHRSTGKPAPSCPLLAQYKGADRRPARIAVRSPLLACRARAMAPLP